MRDRKDTFSWVDGRVLTKLMGELQCELMEYQVHAYDIQFNGKKILGGDSPVMVSCIRLRDAIEKVLEKSRKANERKEESN